MFKTLSILVIAVMASGSGFASSYSVHGDYVEARTADVFTGACVANGEVNLTGKEAILAWRVNGGEWKGVPLEGLSVLAVVKANATLGDNYSNPLPAQSVIIVDEQANASQRDALVDLARDLGGELLQDVVWVQSRPIQFATGGHGEASVKAGELATLDTRCMGEGDHLCGNEDVYYPPLTQIAGAVPAFTLVNEFKGKGLNTTWNSSFKRNAFIGTFTR
jgi:hypothetical protein